MKSKSKKDEIKIRKPVAPPQKAFKDKSKYSRKDKHKNESSK